MTQREALLTALCNAADKAGWDLEFNTQLPEGYWLTVATLNCPEHPTLYAEQAAVFYEAIMERGDDMLQGLEFDERYQAYLEEEDAKLRKAVEQ